ncbi:MAG: hypothetical protein A4E64_01544 [Syntrophorhabdus sp. PtaU1.Bin058]|nr:MAG: hypothetical protein A4E64_01544 [Syntrophorhabdus sp. PtaU1.Bin058]
MIDTNLMSEALETHIALQTDDTGKDISAPCLRLLSEQMRTWPELKEGYETLKGVRVREISCGGYSVRIHYNPGRIKSTLADVRDSAINGRPCFLCPANLPEAQKGILYRKGYMILCNPRPVFHSHFTIAHIDHRPQAIADNIDTFLQLTADFGPGWAVLYNGPQCGASAPDHLHFQAIPSGQMPVEKVVAGRERSAVVAGADNIHLSRLRGVGREIVVLTGDDPAAVGDVFKRFQDALQKVLCIGEEPMMNVAGFYREGVWRLIVFPRAKHRPDAFFREGDGRIVVSPAVVEMGGVIVTPMERDFERLDTEMVEAIYREVSLDAVTVDNAVSISGL